MTNSEYRTWTKRRSPFDGAACPYCGHAMRAVGDGTHPRYATKDHIVPRCNGGKQIVRVCRTCNDDKHHLSLNEWRLVLSWRARRLIFFNYEKVSLRLALQLFLFYTACWMPAF